MAELDESSSGMIMIDDIYEFSAPRFFDFICGETEEDAYKSELWFHTALAYAPSPFMPKIKGGRSVTVESLCDFSEADTTQKDSESSCSSATTCPSEADLNIKEATPTEIIDENISAEKEICESKDCCTPHVPVTDSKKKHTAKKIPSLLRNPLLLKPKNQLQSSSSSQAKGKPSSEPRDKKSKAVAGTPNLAQENQAIKRQKLDGGRTRQILNVKPQSLLHKSKLSLSGTSNICSSDSNKISKENRKVYAREPVAVPFVSTAEMMRKFQSSTRDLSLPRPPTHMKPKLTLTRPKEPEFETSQRVRSVKVMSSAELEEEMMAKIPKFKARPVNKKILEARILPALPRAAPQPPQFQEFHLETMERAHQNAESVSVASTEKSHQHNQWKPCLTDPKTPVLHTSLRARPVKVKSSFELELEELEKVPKFKAKPLNKKIFESKGGLGIFCNEKKQVTKVQEFHFATNERIPPPAASFADIFDKLSLSSEPCHVHKIPRNTRPNPFHLQTEERGAEKERRFVTEVMQKQWEEEQARIPKAMPYPYTTDYPVIPPKPEPKQQTKPEPFQLESLVRHEEELQREVEERRRMEREEAERRTFKAQPILKEDPIPVPEKVRRPLTQVEDFNLHANHRAMERAEFDKKIKDKEMMYKRYREESEAAKMMEEEKALKQLRRTMVPHARPMPKFNQPLLPQKSSKEATKPKSPKLKVLERRERRKFISMR